MIVFPRVAACAAALAVTAGCAAAGPSKAADRSSPADPATVTHSAAAAARPPSKLLIIVEENHTRGSALAGMPYLRRLADTYGNATQYHAITHPSLPNYLAIVGGSTFGVADDNLPSAHRISGRSVFGQARVADKTTKTYAESMPSPCTLTGNTDNGYAVKHNPWAYFVDERAACQSFDVPAGTPIAGALAADSTAGRLPNIGMVVPNLCHDAHDCSLATANAWLSTWMERIMAGPDYRAGRLAVVITFDEGSHSDNNVPFVVVSPHVRHVVVTTRLTHYSLTRAIDAVLGVAPLRQAAPAPSIPPTLDLTR
jgi:hypothetical protein